MQHINLKNKEKRIKEVNYSHAERHKNQKMKKVQINLEGKIALPEGVSDAIITDGGDIYIKFMNLPQIVTEAEVVDDMPKKEAPKN